MSPCGVKCTVFCISLSWWFTLIHGCNLGGIQACMYYEDIKATYDKFLFISEDSYLSQCRRFKTALKCAIRDEYVKGCPPAQTSMLYAGYNVQKAVCQDRAAAYKRSRPCFFQDGLQDIISSCVRPVLRTVVGICDEIENARYCVRSGVRDFPSCSEQDVRLMGKLTDLYFQPFADPDNYDCPMDPFEGEEDEDMEPMPAGDATTTAEILEMTTQKLMNTTTNMTTTTTITTSTTTKSTTTKKSAASSSALSVFLFICAVMATLIHRQL